jgi:hypothetical protein
MKMMLIAGLIITFPAIAIVLFSLGRSVMIPALASLLINSIPFVVAGLLMRKSGGGHGSDLEH